MCPVASAPSDQGPVLGRIDRDGRLVSADPEFAALQSEAGSRVGAELAVPQIAFIAQLARKLGVPVSRPALVGGAEQDVEMWVRATPDGDEVALSLERWTFRAPAPPRLSSLFAQEREAGFAGASDEWAIDPQLRLVSLSTGLAKRIGIDAGDAVGQALTRFFRLEEDEDGTLPLLTGVAARTDFSGQRAVLRSSEQASYVLRGKVVHGADGQFAGFKGEAVPEGSSTSRNVQQGAAELDALLDEALRSPLDRIIETADGIVQQPEGRLRSEYADYASDIAAAARHLLSVVRSMKGEAAGQGDNVDLAVLAAAAAAMLESAAEARGVLIAIEPSAALIAQGDSRQVVQILVNLIGNAVRHSPEGGTVAISFNRSAGAARVNVADQGPGVEAADQQRIFERFERARSDEGGTGLGLAIARRLARAMGGDITLESAPGRGAHFTLCLPS